MRMLRQDVLSSDAAATETPSLSELLGVDFRYKV